VAHAVLLEFGEQLLLLFLVQVIDPAAAVGGHDFQVLGIDLEQPRHEGAALGLQVPEHAYFLLEALAGPVPAEGLVHPPVIADAHQGPNGVFHFVHAAFTSYSPSSEGCWQARAAGEAADNAIDAKKIVLNESCDCLWHIRC
jgi:hypothetical protein